MLESSWSRRKMTVRMSERMLERFHETTYRGGGIGLRLAVEFSGLHRYHQ